MMTTQKSIVQLLALALLVAGVLSAVADIEVYNVSCDLDGNGVCGAGQTLTITGNHLDDVELVRIGSTPDVQSNITCTLNNSDDDHTRTCVLSMDYFPGIYTLTLYELNDDGSYDEMCPAGSLALGQLNGVDLVKFTNAWDHTAAMETDVVTGFNSTALASFDTWTIYGNFTPKREYRVLFYSSEDQGMPTCGENETITPTTVMSKKGSSFANALQCTVRSKPGVMGMFTLLVQDVLTGGYVPGTTGLSTVTVQPSLPVVTAVTGACAENYANCVSGASISFTGIRFNKKNMAYNRIVVRNTDEVTASSGINCTVTDVSETMLTCTLSISDSTQLVTGSFGIYAQVQLCSMDMWSAEKYIGNLMHGSFGSLAIKGVTLTEHDVIASEQVARGASEGNIYTGGWLAVFGVFDSGHTFTFQFYNTQAAGNGVPTCTAYDVTSYMINCTGVTQTLGNLGMYRVLIKDTTGGYYVPTVTTELAPIMVFAPLPAVTGASGKCVAKSSECKSGSTLTFTGSNFVVGKTNEVVFDKSGLSCTTDPVSVSNSLSCTLTVGSGVPAGAYPVYVRSQACAGGMVTPNQPAGYILIGQGRDTKGWSLSPVITGCSGHNGGDDSDDDDDDDRRTGNPAAVAFAIVFGIITLAFIIVAIVMCCCCTFTRKRKASVNYHPDAMSDRYWNADRAMEMNEQGQAGAAPPAAFATTAGTVVGGMGKAAPPMADDRSSMPETRVRELQHQPPSATPDDASKAAEVNKKYNELDFS